MNNFPCGYNFLRTYFLHNSYKRHQIFIIVLTFLVYTCYHASRKPLSIVKTVFHRKCSEASLVEEWCSWKPFDDDNWSKLVGGLEYAFLFTYAVSMFLAGHLAERLNLGTFLATGMALSATTNILFGFGYFFDIHAYTYYLLIQIVGGAVQATGWPAVVTILSNWFGNRRRGLIMGVWNAHTSLGNILGSLIAGYYVKSAWGVSFIVPGLVMLAFALVIRISLVDRPHRLLQLIDDSIESQRIPSTTETVEPPISFWAAVKLPNVLSYATVLFFAKLVAYTFLYWLPQYLTSVGTLPVSAQSAAVLSTIFDLGGILGGIFAGVISDYSPSKSDCVSQIDLSTRITYLRSLTCTVMLALSIPFLFFYQRYASSLSAFSLLLLFINGALVTGPCALITTAVSADLGTQAVLKGNARALATVTAIIDGTGSLGAALGPLLTGLLVPHGWASVFVMLILANLVALLVTISILLNALPSLVSKVSPMSALSTTPVALYAPLDV